MRLKRKTEIRRTILGRLRPTDPALLAQPTSHFSLAAPANGVAHAEWSRWRASPAVSHVTRSCRPRPGHSTETVEQGGVVGLLAMWRGTNEGREVGSATTALRWSAAKGSWSLRGPRSGERRLTTRTMVVSGVSSPKRGRNGDSGSNSDGGSSAPVA
jgi:hypothetical protein